MVEYYTLVVYYGSVNKTDHIETIIKLTQASTNKNTEAQTAKSNRDDSIRTAIADGVTMYAIAQSTGLSETAVAKIRDHR